MDEKTINILCEKFHTTIDCLIPEYTHYMIGKDIVILLTSLILILVSIFILHKNHEKTRNWDLLDWDILDILITITAIVVLFIAVLSLLFDAYDLVLWIASPKMRFFDVVMNFS